MARSGRNCRRCPRRLEFGASPIAVEFGTLARPDSEPLVALNTMLAEDGALLSVHAGVDAGLLLLVSVATDGPPSIPATRSICAAVPA